MAQNPVTITDYLNPIECFQKNMDIERDIKLKQYTAKLERKVSSNFILG